MTPSDLDDIAAAYIDDLLPARDDEFLESVMRQQGVDDLTDIDVSDLSEKQLEWMEDILERAQAD